MSACRAKSAAIFAVGVGLALAGSTCYGQEQDPGSAPAPRAAGVVEFVSGDAMITPKVGDSRLVAVKSQVEEGDTIVTFKGGEAQLRMLDGAYLLVRENSRLKIESYVAEGGGGDRSILDLLQGTVRSITGWIGKFNRAAYEIRTPILVTIGVRGTDHEASYIAPGDPRGEPGVYDKVNEGLVFIKSGNDVVEVPPNRAVYSAWSRKRRPRLLASIPPFFRIARHEREFARRARQSVKNIAEQRQARIREIRRLRGPRPRGVVPEHRGRLRPVARPVTARTVPRRAPRERPIERARPEVRRHR
jgi:FecR protein